VGGLPGEEGHGLSSFALEAGIVGPVYSTYARGTDVFNTFYRDDDDRIYRTYFIDNRGDEAMGSTWAYLDITALGRQEEWEDSPEGCPQTPPYGWQNYLDAYGDAA
jgi:predicted dithiol-disulfide oxidoreductase (DUF899 family)